MSTDISLLNEMKIALRSHMQAAGVRKAELARRIGVHRQEMDRIIEPDHMTNFSRMEQAFTALGKRINIKIVKKKGK